MRPASKEFREERIEPPALKDTGAGATVLYRGRWLYSRKSPAKTAEALAANAAILPGTLVLAFSPALGYGLKTLIERLPADCFVLAVECDRALFEFSARFVKDAVGGAAQLAGERPFAFFFAETPESLARFIDEELFARFKPFRRYLRLDLSAGTALSSAFYANAESLVSDLISSFWKNRATLISFGRKYAENVFRNLGEIAAGNACGLSLAGGAQKPIVVAGAGPSLDAALGFIKRNRGSIFLVAVDAALSALRAHGLDADLAVTVEAQAWIGAAFCGNVPGKNLSAPLLADLASRPKERGRQKRAAFFLTRYAKSRFLERLSSAKIASFEAPPLGSVGLYALYAARLLRGGCGAPVLFAGLEFSWEAGGFSHAKGSSQVLALHSSSTRLSAIETKRIEANSNAIALPPQQGGTPRRTNDAMMRYAALCGTYFSQGGFYRLGEEGLPLDFPSLSIEDAERTLINFEGKSAARPKESDSRPPRFAPAENAGEAARKAALLFLKDEEARLLELRALLAQGSGASDGEARLGELLREADYLCLHFPDYASEKSLDAPRQDFLNRARVEADFFIKTVRAALRQAGTKR